ncbi:DUF4142 domain-containing protein [Verrucomicrobiota bacterium sgz303538]
MKPIAHLLLVTSLILSSSISTGSGASSFPSDRPPGNSVPNSINRAFVQSAGQRAIFYVIAGSLALSHSNSPAVRQFGRLEIRTHNKDFAQLTAIANDLGITVPSGTSDDQFDQLQILSTLFGRAFDRAYLNAVIQQHLKDIKSYTNQANNGANPDLTAFATNHLGQLFAHVQLAFAAAQQSGTNLKR